MYNTSWENDRLIDSHTMFAKILRRVYEDGVESVDEDDDDGHARGATTAPPPISGGGGLLTLCLWFLPPSLFSRGNPRGSSM
jgi:hypothetical protein